MLPEKRFKYVKGLLTVTAKALENYKLSKEQFEELFPTNKKLWESLTSFEEPQPPVIVKEDPPTETTETNT